MPPRRSNWKRACLEPLCSCPPHRMGCLAHACLLHAASVDLQLAQGARLCRLTKSADFTAWQQRKDAQRRRGRLLATLVLAALLAALCAALASGRTAPASPQLLALPHGREHNKMFIPGPWQGSWRSAGAASRLLALPSGNGPGEPLVKGPLAGLEPRVSGPFGGRRERLAILPQLALPAESAAPAAASGAGPEALSPHVASAEGPGPPEEPAGQALAVLAPLTRDRGPLPRGGPSALALIAGSGRAQVLSWRSLWRVMSASASGLSAPDGVLRRAHAAGRRGYVSGLRLTGWAARAALRAAHAGSQLLRQRLAPLGNAEGSPGERTRLALGPGQGPAALASQCPVPQWHMPAATPAADGLAGGGAGVGADVELGDSAAAAGAATSGAGSGVSGAARVRAPRAAAQPTCPPETPWRLAALAAARPPQGGAQLSRVQQPACQAAGFWRPPAAPACLPGDQRPLPAAGVAEAAGRAAPAALDQPRSQGQGPAGPAGQPRRGFRRVRAVTSAVLQLILVGLGLMGWVVRAVWQRLGLLAALALAAISCWRAHLPQPRASAGGGGGSPRSAGAAPCGEPGHEGLRAESATKARQCSLFEMPHFCALCKGRLQESLTELSEHCSGS